MSAEVSGVNSSRLTLTSKALSVAHIPMADGDFLSLSATSDATRLRLPSSLMP